MDEWGRTVHINIFMTFSWVDDRINFTSTDQTYVDVNRGFIESIWTPDFYIYHMKEMQGLNGITSLKGLTVQREDGHVKVFYSMEVNVKFMCPMSFHAFPFESNVCKFELTSYTFNSDQIVFKAFTKKSPTVILMEEAIRDYEVKVEYLKGGDTFKAQTAEIQKTEVYKMDWQMHLTRDIAFVTIIMFVFRVTIPGDSPWLD